MLISSAIIDELEKVCSAIYLCMLTLVTWAFEL